jgi:hypothetical protein
MRSLILYVIVASAVLALVEASVVWTNGPVASIVWGA